VLGWETDLQRRQLRDKLFVFVVNLHKQLKLQRLLLPWILHSRVQPASLQWE
jgi:hypothetical protein